MMVKLEDEGKQYYCVCVYLCACVCVCLKTFKTQLDLMDLIQNVSFDP